MTSAPPQGAAGAHPALVAGIESLSQEPTRGRGSTSDLSIDEVLLLQASGWEPIDLVAGVAVVSIPPYVWNWGQGEIADASQAHAAAFSAAAARLRSAAAHVDGAGVVGVRVELDVQPHHVDVMLSGTAVRRSQQAAAAGRWAGQPFISDLSARDLTLLGAAGWVPLGIAFGASFVYAPRRSASTVLQQSGQNVELTNFTEAMYASREAGMDRMQRSALALGAQGVVAVRITEGPMAFAHHAVGFSTWGTAVRLADSEHRRLDPQLVMPLDDAVVEFEATSLRST